MTEGGAGRTGVGVGTGRGGALGRGWGGDQVEVVEEVEGGEAVGGE